MDEQTAPKQHNNFSIHIEGNQVIVRIGPVSADAIARIYEAVERVLVEIDRERRGMTPPDEPA